MTGGEKSENGLNARVLGNISVYQALLAQQAEEQGIAHFPQVLETHGLQLSIFNDVLQLVMEEFQDSCEDIQGVHILLFTSSVQCSSCMTHFLQHRDGKSGYSMVASFTLFLFTASVQQVQTLDQYTQLF